MYDMFHINVEYIQNAILSDTIVSLFILLLQCRYGGQCMAIKENHNVRTYLTNVST